MFQYDMLILILQYQQLVHQFARLTWNRPNAVPRCSFVHTTVVTIITASFHFLFFSLATHVFTTSFSLYLLPPPLTNSVRLFCFLSPHNDYEPSMKIWKIMLKIGENNFYQPTCWILIHFLFHYRKMSNFPKQKKSIF